MKKIYVIILTILAAPVFNAALLTAEPMGAEQASAEPAPAEPAPAASAVNRRNYREQAISFLDAGRMAVAASKELQSETALCALREETWQWGRRAYFPNLTFGAEENDRVNTAGSDSFMKNYSVGLEQTVFDGGRLSSARKIERAEMVLSKARLETMARQLTDSALGAYRSVLVNRDSLRIQESSLAFLMEQRKIVAEEYRLGKIIELEALEADINIEITRLEIASLKIGLSEAEKQLAREIGLEKLPALTEIIAVEKKAVIPTRDALLPLLETRNSDVRAALFSLRQKEAELKLALQAWLPTITAGANFALSGDRYPLTHHNWSLSLSVDFSTPFINTGFSGRGGAEDYEIRSAQAQAKASPLPNPAAALNTRSARLALAVEKEKLSVLLWQKEQQLVSALEKYALAERKRLVALEGRSITRRKWELSQLKYDIGQVTSIALMEARIEDAENEVKATEAAAQVLACQSAIESLLDFAPGDLVPNQDKRVDSKIESTRDERQL
jgi:outer membrane protein TolC